MGLRQAWPQAEIVGVDIAPQPRYPFRFIRANAMEYQLEGFDFIWASPPCQRYSKTHYIPNRNAASYPDLIQAIRTRLQGSGVPYCIENVPLSPLLSPVTLCGVMFDLLVYRHRLFECSSSILAPVHPRHTVVIGTGDMAQYYDKVGEMVTVAGHLFSLRAGSVAMGIDWMSRTELAESIPPAYSEYIARAMWSAP